MSSIYLVSCVSQKASSPCPASDLYTSDWFCKARAYVQQRLRNGDRWFILSAKYGLMQPDTVAEPYDSTLNHMDQSARRAWGQAVWQQLSNILRPGDDVVFLAGERYRENVAPALASAGYSVQIPMKGLGIGKQKSWFLAQTVPNPGAASGERLQHLVRFYRILDRLEAKLGGKRRLSDCHGRMNWPSRGVYFFFERTEARNHSGDGSRVVRVGTHAVSANSKTTLWQRLAQHRGTGGGDRGNHRGSVFRLLIGKSLIASDGTGSLYPHWGRGQSAAPEIRASEQPLEAAVSAYLGAMPFLWLPVPDAPAPHSLRKYVEKNSIALLSLVSASSGSCDAVSPVWLGRRCPHPRISSSGLWNADHVDDVYDAAFLDTMDRLVHEIEP